LNTIKTKIYVAGNPAPGGGFKPVNGIPATTLDNWISNGSTHISIEANNKQSYRFASTQKHHILAQK